MIEDREIVIVQSGWWNCRFDKHEEKIYRTIMGTDTFRYIIVMKERENQNTYPSESCIPPCFTLWLSLGWCGWKEKSVDYCSFCLSRRCYFSLKDFCLFLSRSMYVHIYIYSWAGWMMKTRDRMKFNVRSLLFCRSFLFTFFFWIYLHFALFRFISFLTTS